MKNDCVFRHFIHFIPSCRFSLIVMLAHSDCFGCNMTSEWGGFPTYEFDCPLLYANPLSSQRLQFIFPVLLHVLNYHPIWQQSNENGKTIGNRKYPRIFCFTLWILHIQLGRIQLVLSSVVFPFTHFSPLLCLFFFVFLFCWVEFTSEHRTKTSYFQPNINYFIVNTNQVQSTCVPMFLRRRRGGKGEETREERRRQRREQINEGEDQEDLSHMVRIVMRRGVEWCR